MNIKQAAQVIRDSVAMDQIIDLYGYQTKKGFMCCPFHGEKEPSLKVYKGTGGWHCFGCDRGGSVIDFVMEHENCNFQTAVRAVDNALQLGLMDPHEDVSDARAQQRIQHYLDDFVNAVYAYADAMIRVIEMQQEKDTKRMMKLMDLKDEDISKVSADDCTFLLTWKDEAQYNDYRMDRLKEFKEEVAAWRREQRRAT